MLSCCFSDSAGAIVGDEYRLPFACICLWCFSCALTLSRQSLSACRRTALLVGGDAAALLVFAAIGRRNHGEGLQLLEILNTALPFLVGLSLLLLLITHSLLLRKCIMSTKPDILRGTPTLLALVQTQHACNRAHYGWFLNKLQG